VPWYSLTVDLPGSASELAEHLLHECGASGLETRDDQTRAMPGSRAPKPGEVIVVGYFEKKAQAARADKRLKKEFKEARTALEPVATRDWSVEWRSQIRSVTVGRLWVGPPWERETAPRDKVCLFIEPKMAFGTGDHPTTALCLAAVDEFMKDNQGASVLDVGTGTGVLAFAAKKLGAMRVVGTDNDPVAIELAKECATENGLTDLDLSVRTLDKVEGTFDLVLANILANTLVQLAPRLAAKTKHRLVLAGVLVPQADEVRTAFEKQGLQAIGAVAQGEWIRLDFERP
jgi:ribosomal protein L11 methyltransferase